MKRTVLPHDVTKEQAAKALLEFIEQAKEERDEGRSQEGE